MNRQLNELPIQREWMNRHAAEPTEPTGETEPAEPTEPTGETEPAQPSEPES